MSKYIFIVLIVFIVLILIKIVTKGLNLFNNYLKKHYTKMRNCVYEFIHSYWPLVIIFLVIVFVLLLMLAIKYDSNNGTDLGEWFSGTVALLIALSTFWRIPPFLKIFKSWGSANDSCSIQIVNITRESDFIELRHIYLTNNLKGKSRDDCQILIPRYMNKYTKFNYIAPHGSLFIPIFVYTKGRTKKEKCKESTFINNFLNSRYKYLRFEFIDTYNIDIPYVYFSKNQIKYKNDNIRKLD